MEDTSAATAFWAAPRDSTAWVTGYRDSLHTRHRAVILEALDASSPWRSVHELGCHCGPNLRLIRQRFPWSVCTGSDVNTQAIEEGRRWFALDPNVSLWQANLLDDLNTPYMEKPDIILTCYTLAYVAPEDLHIVLRRLVQEARRGVILAEPMAPASQAGSLKKPFPEWSHDYAATMGAVMQEQGRDGIGVIRMVDPPVDNLNAVLTVTWEPTA